VWVFSLKVFTVAVVINLDTVVVVAVVVEHE
jgi:hypothetical protein